MKNTKKILIVEDEKPIVEALTIKLTKEGYEPHFATTGEAGLALTKDLHPDLILLDFILPDMDGLSFLKTLRLDKWGKSAQVLILTNLSDGKIADEVAEYGVFDYLIKADWRLDDVVKKVKEKVGRGNK
ncbi:MAG: response regulator [Candidatus Magasanikbacteria bacterium]|jgi:DNA-binding response OmpR family regulator